MTNDQAWPVSIILYQSFPWYIRIFVREMSVSVNDANISKSELVSMGGLFQPAVFEGTPAILEFPLEIPPHSSAIISVPFEAAFLHLEDFPADPSRGLDLPVSVVSVVDGYGRDSKIGNECDETDDSIESSPLVEYIGLVCAKKHQLKNATGKEKSFKRDHVRIYSNLLLVFMPMPDFSMPYNVITLSSTLIALITGSLINLYTRKRKEQNNKEGKKEEVVKIEKKKKT